MIASNALQNTFVRTVVCPTQKENAFLGTFVTGLATPQHKTYVQKTHTAQRVQINQFHVLMEHYQRIPWVIGTSPSAIHVRPDFTAKMLKNLIAHLDIYALRDLQRENQQLVKMVIFAL